MEKTIKGSFHIHFKNFKLVEIEKRPDERLISKNFLSILVAHEEDN